MFEVHGSWDDVSRRRSIHIGCPGAFTLIGPLWHTDIIYVCIFYRYIYMYDMYAHTKTTSDEKIIRFSVRLNNVFNLEEQ